MNMFEFLMKSKAPEPFAERNFECKRGDLTIRGTEYKPEGEILPVAIVCHGFMASGTWTPRSLQKSFFQTAATGKVSFKRSWKQKIAQSSFSMTWTIGMIRIFSWRNCLC